MAPPILYLAVVHEIMVGGLRIDDIVLEQKGSVGVDQGNSPSSVSEERRQMRRTENSLSAVLLYSPTPSGELDQERPPAHRAGVEPHRRNSGRFTVCESVGHPLCERIPLLEQKRGLTSCAFGLALTLTFTLLKTTKLQPKIIIHSQPAGKNPERKEREPLTLRILLVL